MTNRPHFWRYRLEIHCAHANTFRSEIWLTYQTADGDGSPLWSSEPYDLLDDAYAFGKYELEERAEADREAAQAKRLAERENAAGDDISTNQRL